MVGKVLTNNHGITERESDTYRLAGFNELSVAEIANLEAQCINKIEDYVAQRGDRIWAHRRKSSAPAPPPKLGGLSRSSMNVLQTRDAAAASKAEIDPTVSEFGESVENRGRPPKTKNVRDVSVIRCRLAKLTSAQIRSRLI